MSPESASKLVRRLAFWDLVLIRSLNDILPQSIAAGSVWACVEEILAFATQSQVMEWTAYAKDDPSLNDALRSGHALEALHDRNLAFIDAAVNAPLTPISRRKNEYLTHGFHKYKAKFFPRLARHGSMLRGQPAVEHADRRLRVGLHKVRHFLELIANQASVPIAPLTDAVAVTSILESEAQSLATGRAVAPDLFGR